MKKYKDSFVFYFLLIIFFIIYFRIVYYFYNKWIDYTIATDIFLILFLAIVIIPLSAISTHHFIKIIKN